ncbi:hypothetical protein ACLOJK_033259 [Asimina triloba]
MAKSLQRGGRSRSWPPNFSSCPSRNPSQQPRWPIQEIKVCRLPSLKIRSPPDEFVVNSVSECPEIFDGILEAMPSTKSGQASEDEVSVHELLANDISGKTTEVEVKVDEGNILETKSSLCEGNIKLL